MSNKHSLLTLAPLFLVIVIDTMGVGLVIPVLSPLFTLPQGGILPLSATLAWRDFLYGLTLSCLSFFMLLGAPFLGDLSDYIGRKKVLLACLIGTAFSYAISAFGVLFHSVLWLIVGRCLTGVFAGSQPIAQAAIADVSSQENKAMNMGSMMLAACIGFVIGPIIAGYFTNSHWVSWFNFSTPFFIAGLLSILNTIGLAFTFQDTYVPSPHKKLQLTKGLLVFIAAFTDNRIRWLNCVLFILQIGFSIYFVYVALFFVQEFHYDATQVGHFMGYIGLIWSVTLTIIVRIILKFLNLQKLVLASLISITVGFLFTFWPGKLPLWLSAIPICVGDGLSYTGILALLSNKVDKNSQGWVMGIGSAVVAAAWAVGGTLAGMLGSVYNYLPFIAGFLLALFSLLLFLYPQEKIVSSEIP